MLVVARALLAGCWGIAVLFLGCAGSCYVIARRLLECSEGGCYAVRRALLGGFLGCCYAVARVFW